MFNIVLVEPEIPQNTGNIARTCAATGCRLHLVAPLGFSISSKALKRAGLDYWDKVFVKLYDSIEEFMSIHGEETLLLASTKGKTRYDKAAYPPGCFILFGKETAGLPKELLDKYPQQTIRLPMLPGLRSLNLSNSVAVIVYEAFRQNNFSNLV
jgi:tRNA (cytidine/uridine-2'-O-)-methyltransferase